MATHGRARQVTIDALKSRKAFFRSGFAMKGVDGASGTLGELPQQWREAYNLAAKENNLRYTVKSYDTPIAWVLNDGTVIIPSVKYSVTTTNHQSLCRVYL